MVDTTAFARFLPTLQGAGLAGIKAAQAGQQMGLAQRESEQKQRIMGAKLGEIEREQAMKTSLDDIGRQAKEAWMSGDQRAFSGFIGQMASIDPDSAKELNNVLGTLSKQNAVESGINYFAAMSLPMNDIEGQNAILTKAQEPLPEGHPFRRWLEQVKMLPAGEQRIEAMQGGLNFATQLGMIPGAKPDDTKLQKTGAYLVRDKDTQELSIVAGSYNTSTGEMKVSKGMLPSNFEVVSKMGQTAEEAAKSKVQTAAKSEAAKKAVQASEKYAERAMQIQEGISTFDEGIRIIEDAMAKGENLGVGPIKKYLPKWNKASAELENVANNLGLNVIQSVTFGALSQSEMEKAMATAMPPNLKGPELAQWLKDKKAGQQKLSNYLREAAAFIGSEDLETGEVRTKSDWLAYQEGKKPSTGRPKSQQAAGAESAADIFKELMNTMRQ